MTGGGAGHGARAAGGHGARADDRSTLLLWAGLSTVGLLTVVTLAGSLAATAVHDEPATVASDVLVEPAPAGLPQRAPHRPRAPDAQGWGSAASAAGLRSPEPLVVHRPQPVPETPPLGRVDGLRLHHPAPAPLAVGFHEAATERALPMRPIGRPVRGRGDTWTQITGATAATGWPYVILGSRGRSSLPSTAVDVALRDGEPVLAPVSGEVTDVRSYLLEGRYPDRRIEIRPDDAPTRRVVVIHVEDVQVSAGDRVEAGRTPMAGTARRFPFVSQIDSETAPDHWPHVHIEVQREPPPEPLDGVPHDEGALTASG